MFPDVIKIGTHAYALTLNLILTGFIGLLFSIALFYWTRKVKRYDQKRDEERKEREADKRASLLLKEAVDESRHKTVVAKVDTICLRLDKIDQRFDGHEHLIEVNGQHVISKGIVASKLNM